MGFALKEPGLRGTAFHRMTCEACIVGILVADHLPSGKARSAKVNRWPMMEIAGGAQAIERGMDLALAHEDGFGNFHSDAPLPIKASVSRMTGVRFSNAIFEAI